MIPRDALEGVRKIVCHGACPDGTASAMILADAFPNAEVEFVHYGSKRLAELPVEPGMLFCDITPPRERAQEFVAAGAIVLDHHRHARDVVEAFGDRGRFADEDAEPGVSGALLAFQVWEKLIDKLAQNSIRVGLVAQFAFLAGVRDTWRKDSPAWDDACAQAEVLVFYPPEHWTARGRNPWLTPEETRLGQELLRKARTNAERAKRGAWRTVVAPGVELAVIQGRHTSDVAELLREEGVQLCAGFHFETEGDELKCTWSLRSNGAVDVGAFAKERGGGGHSKAAGFTERPEDCLPHHRIATLLVDYLARGRS